ncbi:hypothetical protein LX32DRAFT_724617 [Colletotrichum zoysiae]|uniref:Uncharacterized protein n=1 Tax=Colletotrichum zoysiae TaxID=1216348 RepID=A0AAD9HS46_9PEZI|nr:hypothetical protein LX32DRAFT_724617 [Colletotrichum zoysiae]
MAPTPTRSPKSVDAAASALHRLVRRGEGGRVAGMFVGCLIGGIAAVALVYLCFNCAFAPHSRGKTAVQPARPHAHKAHPHCHRAPSPVAPTARPHPHTHTHIHRHQHQHQHPNVHGWTHRHRKHARHHHHSCRAKPGGKQCPKAQRKTMPQPAHRDRRRPPQTLGGGQTVRFMPMPPMTAMPVPPAAAAAAVGTGTDMGMGMGVGGGANMAPLEDGFVDYGPALGHQDFGPGMGWDDDADPDFRLEGFAAVARDAPDDGDATCNECCYSFFDALCGVPKGARDLRREAAGDGEVVLGDNEMAAV